MGNKDGKEGGGVKSPKGKEGGGDKSARSQATKGTEFIQIEKQLTELPKNIQSLKCTKFDVSKNDISEIPVEISEMKFLEVLIMDDNRLNGLPEELGSVISLKELHFANNKLFFLSVSGFAGEIEKFAYVGVAK